MKYRFLVIFTVTSLVLSFLPAFFAPTQVQAASIALLAGQDTYIQSGLDHQNTNFGDEESLRVGHYQAIAPPYSAYTDRALLEFTVWYGGEIPTNSTITLACLQLYYYDYDGDNPAGDTIHVQRLKSEWGRNLWVESVATWNIYKYASDWGDPGASSTAFDYTTTNQASTTVPGSFGWMDWDVTAQVQYALDEAIGTVEIRVAKAIETSSSLLYFYSREHSNATYRPKLLINYIPPQVPTVGTIGADNVTFDSATAWGKVINVGSADVTIRGFKYGLTQSSTWDKHETGNFTTGDYSLSLTGLAPDTPYYFRAYATNAYGTSYGSWESLITVTGIPAVTTDSVYVYEYCSGINAIMSGTITDEGNSTVVTRGFQYGLNPYSAAGDVHEHGFWPTGSYSLTEFITSNASYWFRAYATNGEGTGFGIWKPFYSTGETPGDCSGGSGANVTGSGTVGDPYVIWSDYGLQDMQNHLSSYWELGCTIDASATMGWNGGDGFVPVGTFASPFYGSFNGNNHTISGLYINRPSSDRQALFGAVSLSTIQNVYVLNATISGKAQNGVLIGRTLHSHPDPTVQYCIVSGSVAASTGNAMTGGLIGEADGGTIYRCASSATVNGYGWVGGLIGYCGSVSTTVTVRECFATGAVVGSADVGGLAGFHYYSAIYDSYARGSVYGSTYYEGGLTGEMYTASGSRSYSTGSVSSPYTYKGGLVGRLYNGSCISSSFWDTQTSSQSTSACGIGKTTTEMKTQTTFTNAGWDFTTIWGMDELINDGYPYLRWALATPPQEATQYTLTLSSTSGGNVTLPGEGDFEYEYGTTVNLVATPDPGYRFALWVGDVSEVNDVQSFSTTVTVNDDYSIVAVFVEAGKLALYISSTGGGDCTNPGEGLFSYDYGDFVDIEATPGGGYAFSLWSGNVDTIADVYLSTTTIEMLDDYAIKANFATTGNYALIVSSTDGGDVYEPGEGTYTYPPAAVVDLMAWPNFNYWFVEWSGDVGAVANVTDPTTTITMNGNYSIMAVFESGADFELTTSSSAGGDVATPGEGTYTYSSGTTVNIGATADAGYDFLAWTGDVSTIADTSDNTTTIVMTGDYEILANFVPAEVCSLLLTISSAEGGYVAEPGEGVFTFPCNTEVTITAIAYEGYWFKEWIGDTGSVANPLSLNTTVLVHSNFFIEATFEEEESPPLGAPNVTTENATSITTVSATLHGALVSLGNYTEAYVFLQYGINTTYGTNTPMQLRTSVGNFSRTISGLATNTTYHYRAAAQYDSYVYGLDGNFTTLSEESEEPPGYDYNTCDGTYEYESYTTGDNETATIYGANWFAQTFNVTEAFKISAMRLKLSKTGTPGALTVSLRDVDGMGKPTGVDLVSASYEGTGTSTGWYEITMPTYRLETDEYAIVVRAIAGDAGSYISWYYDPTGVYDGGACVSSSDSGVSWSVDEDKDLMFQMFGTTVLCIMDVKVFSGYLEDDDWLIAIHYLNEFPPYYGVATPSDYFDLQLVVGGEVVASVGVPLWGNMPGSIYLSQELASTLEWGSIYTVRMRGSFSPYPTSTYTLIPADWRGQDLNLLDAWVFEVASVMSTYYEQSMTTYIARRLVLNDAGSALFATGIPMLAAVRPLIFLDPELYTPESAEDWQRTYENAQHWQEVLGAKITSDAEAAGNIFGVTGMQFAQVAFFGTWFVASLGAAAFAGIAALVVSLPFLAGGWYAGLIPTTIFAVLGSIFILVLVWYFWIRGGG